MYKVISFRQFKTDFLDTFADAVRAGKFKKMDYSMWRELSRCQYGNDELVALEVVNAAKLVVGIDGDFWEFPFWDQSFGSFFKTILDTKRIEIKNTNKNNIDKENEMMNGVINFDFGPCSNGDNVRMSIYGIAVKNASGTFVSYDAKNASIMDVDVFNFDGAKFLYKMPVAIKDIAVGDVVIHARKPMFVTEVLANSKSLKVVDPVNGEKKEIILTRSPFGFDFVTKIVNFLGNIGGETAASADNPFGNLWMFMLMNDKGDADSILPFLLMGNNGGEVNPLMLYALAGKDKGDNSWLPFLMMANANKGHTCHCDGKCGNGETN